MSSSTIRKWLEPWLRRVLHLYFRIVRGMTMGVRAVVLNADNQVLLVKHTYVMGWHLPGGGVEVGQTCRAALARELMEEVRVELLAEPKLHGVFLSSHVSPRDHVLVYVVRQFRQLETPPPNREIAASGFFDVGKLPEDTTLGTRQRIAEVLAGAPPLLTWRP